MDTSAISALTSVLGAAQAQETAGAGVLRDSLKAEQAVAVELIQAISIPGLGENVDLKA
jgi:hypothetical protein